MKDQVATKPQVDQADTLHARAVHTALLIRRTEEKLLELFAQGKLFGTVHTCLGQEWTGVAVAEALKDGDFVISNHRCHGHYLAWTDDVEGLIAEVMGKESGTCGGRGGSQHLCRDSFLSNGIQGGMAPVAAGMALARRMKTSDAVGTIFIGDGTLGEGTLYETLNITSKWDVPLLFVLENNLYAQSTSQSETLAGDIRARAAAFGIATGHGDTWNWQALLTETQRCVDLVRTTGRPMFLQIDTYRLGPHSKGDDNRDKGEITSYAGKDPVNQILKGANAELATALGLIEHRVSEAALRADGDRFQSPAVLQNMAAPAPLSWSAVEFADERMVKSIRNGLHAAMQRDERVVLLGEDIRSPYGGAFKATQGLSDDFPGRVRNTPISEASIVGIGSGLALEGMRPVVELMFGDFVMLAADQIVNHAAKFRFMYNDQVEVPLIVRTPMGGKRGYGPTHSQCLEKHLFGIPGTQMLAVTTRFAPDALYAALFDSIDRPTIVIENKLLYGQMATARVPAGYVLEKTADRFPTLRLRPADGLADVTLVAYGGMVAEAEAAMTALFEEHDLVGELLIPLRLFPLDMGPIVDSVARTGRVVVAEEGQGFAGFGSEVLSQLAEHGLPQLRATRVSAAPHAIPSARPLEELALPTASSIVRAALELIDV